METLESYTCSCYPGYTLEPNGHTCTGMYIDKHVTLMSVYAFTPVYSFNQIHQVEMLLCMYMCYSSQPAELTQLVRAECFGPEAANITVFNGLSFCCTAYLFYIVLLVW